MPSVKQIVNIGELRLVFTFLNWLHVVVWVVSRNYCYLNIDRNDTGNKTKVNSWSKLFTVIATVLIFVVFPRATLCDELADWIPMWCNLTECFSFHGRPFSPYSTSFATCSCFWFLRRQVIEQSERLLRDLKASYAPRPGLDSVSQCLSDFKKILDKSPRPASHKDHLLDYSLKI